MNSKTCESFLPSSSDPSPGELLAWYDQNCRQLPWRVCASEKPDPYKVWLSEIMLQQTTVATVIPYYVSFLKHWPNVQALAAASRDDVLSAWAGLGYYARARHLHDCAIVVASQRGGLFPSTEEELLQLPGIGPYTAAAIASIAFGHPAAAIDGNVTRVLCRIFNIDAPPSKAFPTVRKHAVTLLPSDRCGDYTQALMELGATVCTPRAPRCVECPWRDNCQAYALGKIDALPQKKKKVVRPRRQAVAFWLTDGKGQVWLRQRPEKGLLGGMLEVPSSPWTTHRFSWTVALRESPVSTTWARLPGTIRHVFSHFDLELTVVQALLPRGALSPSGGLWVPYDELNQKHLPTVMKKIARHVFASSS